MRIQPSRIVLLVTLWATIVTTSPAPAGDGEHTSGGSYLIIHASHLEKAAAAWADYRTEDGWNVVRHPVEPTDDVAAQRRALRRTIRQFALDHQEDATLPIAVLLLGDADPRGVPTWTFPQLDPALQDIDDDNYATDHPYQLIDDTDDLPDIALGRIPARTNDETIGVLEKIKRYEHDAPFGLWRRRIAYAAGKGRFGLADTLLEMLFKQMATRLVPDEFDVSMTYAKASSIYCPAPSKLTDTVLDQLGEGALLFNYIGHGSAERFDYLNFNGQRLGILNVDDLARLTGNHARFPIALLTCCSAGWYDLPDDRLSLAETMLLHPAGPVAVIAGSRITHPYANMILQKDITQLLFGQRIKTVGELDLLATRSMIQIDAVDRSLDALVLPIAIAQGWKSTLSQLRQMHAHLYNLLGDPALRIALPVGRVEGLTLNSERITGRVPNMQTGRVVITIETARTKPARADQLVPVQGTNDLELETKATHNYPLANERVLVQFEGEVKDGRFEITLDKVLPSSAALIKAYVVGEDDTGRTFDAIGATRVPRQ
ncbi:MAG: C25 family cysteine peptidase [Phycisphaerales bacterium]